MAEPASIAGAEWLNRPATRAIFDALDARSGRTRAVGGIVRDTVLGIGRADIDLATEFTPEEVMARAGAAGIAVHPTGIEHGTVTLVEAGMAVEVTTLRQDIETDGRHAVVRFGTDWQADAARRDFTINAVYAFEDGRLFDPLGGIADCLAKRVVFIGDPDARIAEDFLRVLRFFRFFALYGQGRPDAEGLKACARAKDRLAQLSAERVWAELKKLLGAADPSRALLWMRSTGILGQVLPESERWGIDAIHGLVATGAALGWPHEPLLRLMGLIPPHGERVASLAGRLKLANAERARLEDWVAAETPDPGTPGAELTKLLYRGRPAGITDRLRLALSKAEAANKASGPDFRRLLAQAEAFRPAKFPLTGKDLVTRGFTPGPAVGRRLVQLENDWIESGFALTRRQLLTRIGAPD